MAYAANNASGSNNNWSSRFPVYQIDFTAVASGKRVATSKRRIRWRFGLSNQVALDAGESGTACRGEEHDVTVVWSVTSGKRLILADGQEVHYSTTRSSIFEFSWTMRGNHVLKVVCNAAPPISGKGPARQYDLSVDGMSFFTMPKVYELGIRGSISSRAPVSGPVPSGRYSNQPSSRQVHYDQNKQQNRQQNRQQYNSNAPTSQEQENEDMKRAVQNSIEESRRHLSRKTNTVSSSMRLKAQPDFAAPVRKALPPSMSAPVDLLDFGALTVSQSQTNQYSVPQAVQQPAAVAYSQNYGGGQGYNSNQYQTTTSAPPPTFADVYNSSQVQGEPNQVAIPTPNTSQRALVSNRVSDISSGSAQSQASQQMLAYGSSSQQLQPAAQGYQQQQQVLPYGSHQVQPAAQGNPQLQQYQQQQQQQIQYGSQQQQLTAQGQQQQIYPHGSQAVTPQQAYQTSQQAYQQQQYAQYGGYANQQATSGSK